MKKRILYAVTAVIAVFNSCSNDFDVTEDWKETMVIIGLLNQSDSIQYIRVNKAYLGDGNALVMGGVYDSINYANTLTVVLNEITNNIITNTFLLERDTSIIKPPGVFAYPNQVLFKTNAFLNEDKQYELVVTNNETQKIARSKTKLVKNFYVNSPTGSQQVNFTNPNFPFRVEWASAVNGRLYNLIVRFYYFEQNKVTLAIKDTFIDWEFTNVRGNDLQGGEILSITFPGEQFYTFLSSKGNYPGQQLYPSDSLWRHAGKSSNENKMLDFILTVAGEEFATYLDVASTSGVLQERPVYTNIDGGIGIFSARYTQKSTTLYGKMLTSQSLDSLYAGQHTYDLGFCSPSFTSPYFCQ